jgi:hypothetical protein
VTCTKEYLKNQVDEWNTDLCCPGQCDEAYSDAEINHLLGAEKYYKYETLVQEQCVSQAIENGDLDGFEKCTHVSPSLSRSVSVWSSL